jgi:hypothetical protein
MQFDLGSNLVVALSEKKDGDMSLEPQEIKPEKVRKNRKEFLSNFSVKPSNVVFAKLSHGDNLEVVLSANKGEVVPNTDGLLARDSDLYLGFTVADCLPVFLFEPELGLVGLIHCGWQGLALDILCKTCGKIKKNWGKTLEKIRIFIGPGICGEHFQVHPERAEKFSQYPKAIQKNEGQLFLDLKRVAKAQLFRSGIKEKNIKISTDCTYEAEEKYYSYRRNQTSLRHLALVGRENKRSK